MCPPVRWYQPILLDSPLLVITEQAKLKECDEPLGHGVHVMMQLDSIHTGALDAGQGRLAKLHIEDANYCTLKVALA